MKGAAFHHEQSLLEAERDTRASAMCAFQSRELIPPSISAFTFTACTSYFRFILWHLFYQSPEFQFCFHWLQGQEDSFSSTIYNFPILITSLLFFFLHEFVPGVVLVSLLVISTVFNSKAMVLSPKSCKSQGQIYWPLSFSFLPSPFAMCQLLLGVGGKVQMLWGAFCCVLKQDLSFKHVWNNDCSAKSRLAWELAPTSSEPLPSHCLSLLFLLFLGQLIRNSLFPRSWTHHHPSSSFITHGTRCCL